MKMRRLTLTLGSLALACASFAASADILFSNLGTNAPPAVVGSHTVTPFNQAAQAAVPDFTTVSIIPGNPVSGDLSLSLPASKRTVGVNWWAGNAGAWGHGYTGPVFYVTARPLVLTLPSNTRAFYFYVQPDQGGTFNVTATTDSNVSSGPIPVSSGPSGSANGFAFYSTAGEAITSISITNDAGFYPGMAVAEFGIGTGPTTTCASEGYTGTKLEWCKNICERGYTGGTLAMWIRRWTDRYRTLPYCAIEPQPVPGLR